MRKVVLSLIATFTLGTLALPQTTAALRLAKTILLPGVEGRIDHFAIDVKTQRLFVAALGNNTLEVVDLTNGKRLRTITGLRKPQGVVLVADTKRLFAAIGDDGVCKVCDTDSFKLIATVPELDDADNVRFDASAKRIYVGYGEGALAVINATTMKKAGDVKLAKHPESFQLEKSGPRLFVNVPDAKQIAVINRNKQKVIATWPLTEYQANFPMALDEANHRLFVGCRKPARLVVVDTKTGKVVTALPCVGDTDDIFYDAGRKRIYVSGGEGFISVFGQKDADHYAEVAKIATAAGARTSLWVPELNRLFVAVPHRGSQQAEIRVYETTKEGGK